MALQPLLIIPSALLTFIIRQVCNIVDQAHILIDFYPVCIHSLRLLYQCRLHFFQTAVPIFVFQPASDSPRQAPHAQDVSSVH